MKKWLRRIRAAFSTALTWAAAWGGVGTILALVILAGGGGFGIGTIAMFAFFGFLAGATFSSVLGVAEGRRRFDQMSLPRFAFLGAVGGLLLSGLLLLGGTESWSDSALTSGVITLLGMGSAAGSLALARRADDRELLEHGADVADIGLTTEEKRELLTE